MARLRKRLASLGGIGSGLTDGVVEKVLDALTGDEGILDSVIEKIIDPVIESIKESSLVDDIIEEVTEAVIEEIVEALTGREIDIELGDDGEEEERVLDMNIKTEELDDEEFGIE